jgi:hypothetical protein
MLWILDSRSHIQYVLNKFLLLVLNKHQFRDFLLRQVSSPLLMEKMRRCQQLSSLGEHAFTTYSRQSLLKVWRYPFLCECGTFCNVCMQYFLAVRCRWQNDKLGQTLFQREAFHPCYACRSWLDVFHLKNLIMCTTSSPVMWSVFCRMWIHVMIWVMKTSEQPFRMQQGPRMSYLFLR